jgi:3-hydroxymyristoyl/3-hydroxydecanoyl-(acyl carrier protein) dehydratase
MGAVSQETRTVMFVMLGTLIINAIWQAADLSLARLENVILSRLRSRLSCERFSR